MGGAPMKVMTRSRPMGDKLDHAREVASEHLDAISKLFKPGAKLTLIVRFDDDPEHDFLLTDDAITLVELALQRAKERADG